MSKSVSAGRFAIAVLLIVAGWAAPSAKGQVAVRGTVTNSETNQPLPGVNVSVRGTTLGTTTALNGTYLLDVPDGDVILVFRFVGFQMQEHAAPANQAALDVALIPAVLGLEEVVIVGSRRQARLVKDSAVPVDVLGPRDLQSLASTDLDDVLRTQIPSYNVQTALGDEAIVVRPATLRGLPTDNVVVLINGKRRHRSGSIALSGSALNEGAQGPDLNMIPSIALRQVELLRDAATAQYGADAVAGVFNMQLREESHGIRLRMQGGQHLEGDGRYGHVAANTGFQLPRSGFVNLSMEYRDVQPTVRSAQRDDAQILAERGYPVADPAQRWGKPEVSHSVVGFVNAGLDIAAGVRAYAFGGGGRRAQEGGFFFRAPGTATARSSVFRFGSERAVIDLVPENDLVCSELKSLPDLNASNGEVQDFVADQAGECFLFNELFPGGFTPRFGADAYDISGTIGVRGERPDGLNWDFSVGGARSLLNYFIYNTVNASFGPDTPTSFKPRSYFQQEMDISLGLSYPLETGRLASPIHVAWGATWRTEIFESRPGDDRSWEAGPYADQGFSVGSNGYQGLNPAFAGRWTRPNFAVYLDAEADVTRQWLADFALRYENFYDDFGSTLTGKLATLFRATNRISLRATASTGFRAPTPGQSNLNVFRTTGFSKEHGLVEVGLLPSTHPIALALGGEALTPELARSLSMGLVVDIGNGATLTADYFNIALHDRLALTGNIQITDEIVQIIDAADILGGVTNIREVRFYSNDFSTHTRGLDVLLAWQREISRKRAASGSIAWNWTVTDLTEFTVPRQITEFLGETLQAPLELSLLTKQRQIELERLNPRNRLVATHRQVLTDWSLMVRLSWFDSWEACRFRSATCRSADGADMLDYYEGVWLTDAEIGYSLRESWHIAVGAYNLFDVNRAAHPEEVGRQGNLYARSTPFDYSGTAAYLRLTADLY